MDIEREASIKLVQGHTQVNLVSTRLTPLDLECFKGILVRAPGILDPTPNTACIWVGGLDVTADSGANGGMPVAPGESMFIPVARSGGVHVVSQDAGQDLAWILT